MNKNVATDLSACRLCCDAGTSDCVPVIRHIHSHYCALCGKSLTMLHWTQIQSFQMQ